MTLAMDSVMRDRPADIRLYLADFFEQYTKS